MESLPSIVQCNVGGAGFNILIKDERRVHPSEPCGVTCTTAQSDTHRTTIPNAGYENGGKGKGAPRRHLARAEFCCFFGF